MFRRRLSLLCVLVLAVGLIGSAGPASAATVTGNDLDNALFGTPRSDTLDAKDGNDFLFGGLGNDRLVGGIEATDADQYFGGPGVDRYIGGPGVDFMVDDDGRGDDVLRSGAGADRVVSADGAKDKINCGPDDDFAIVDASDSVKGCEVLFIGTHFPFGYFFGTNNADVSPPGYETYLLRKGNDTHTGTAFTQSVFLGRGNDTITAGTGSLNVYDDDGSGDTVTGNAGGETIYSADGAADAIDCGADTDTVYKFTADPATNCEVEVEGNPGTSIDLP